MNLAEAKAKFPIGSKVRVTDNGGVYSSYDRWAKKHFCSKDYLEWNIYGIFLDVGDVGEVMAVDEHEGIDTHLPIAGIRIEGKKPFIISCECIEPYEPETPEETPEETPILAAFETGNGYRVSFDGSRLAVTAHGETVIRSVEELLDEIVDECYRKHNEIHVGDTVRIKEGEDCYPCYIDWLQENLTFEQALRFDWENTPETGLFATVVAIAPHLELNKNLYLVEVELDAVSRLYLMNREALEKI